MPSATSAERTARAALLVLASVACPATALATAYRWTGGAAGDWTTPSAWTPQGVPGLSAADTATIDAATVTLAYAPASALASLALSGGAKLRLEGDGWTLSVTADVGTVTVDSPPSNVSSIVFADVAIKSTGITIVCKAMSLGTRSSIDASGQGHAGGDASTGGGNGAGPGGGSGGQIDAAGGSHAGFGGRGSDGSLPSATYGNFVAPTAPGSGGGASVASASGGGAGGGRIRIRVDETFKNDGAVTADGLPGFGDAGGGAGGSVWISAGVATGLGKVTARGGDGAGRGGDGAGGRIVIDGFTGTIPWELSARGGKASAERSGRGGAGVIAVTPLGGTPDVTIDNKGFDAGPTPLEVTANVNNLILRGMAAVYLRPDERTKISGALIVPAGETATAFPLSNLGTGGHLTVVAARVDISGTLDLSGTGYPGAKVCCAGSGPGGGGGSAANPGGSGGGGHGGNGGAGGEQTVPVEGGKPYGSVTAPVDHGSGGGTVGAGEGGSGGGRVHLEVSGEFRVDNAVVVNGARGDVTAGGGAGGSIFVTANSMTGVGTLGASGGGGGAAFTYPAGGGGAGGRIALFVKSSVFAGSAIAAGGSSSGWSTAEAGSVKGPTPDSLVTLDSPADMAPGFGVFSWAKLVSAAGGYTVHVDDDVHLGPGEPTGNHPETGEATRQLTTYARAAAIPGLTVGTTYWWQVVAKDSAGDIVGASPLHSFVMTQDPTPPVAGSVNDGQGADIDFQASATTLSANWSGFSDPETGIEKYEWAAGTSPGATDVLGFTSTGANTSAKAAGLSLMKGTTYYATVRAFNGAALPSTATSDGVQILGGACAGPGSCKSGFCVDQVCCDTACNAGCDTCAAATGAPADGTCGVATGARVCRPKAGECDEPDVCDRINPACPGDQFVADGTPCSAGECRAGACVPPDVGLGDAGLPHRLGVRGWSCGCGTAGASTAAIAVAFLVVLATWRGRRRRAA